MKLFKMFLPLLAVVSLSGCVGTSVNEKNVVKYGCIETMTNTSVSLKCERLDGTLEYTFTVPKSDNPHFNIDISLTLGALTLTLGDSKGENEYLTDEIIIDNYKDTITLYGSGKHKLKIIADEFKGSYSFNWNK